jgi:hypothetical protein
MEGMERQGRLTNEKEAFFHPKNLPTGQSNYPSASFFIGGFLWAGYSRPILVLDYSGVSLYSITKRKNKGKSMKKIGFLVGHPHYLSHARLLCQSIFENTALGERYELCILTPRWLDVDPQIPGVTPIGFQMPARYRSIPFADKMFAAAAFENTCPEGYIWLDVDSYFFKPVEFFDDQPILLNPVDQRNIGDRYGEERTLLWQAVNGYFQLPSPQAGVLTGVTQEHIYPYFNAGMVVVNRHCNLFATVQAALSDLLENNAIRDAIQNCPTRRIFFHQAVFSAAVLKTYPEGAAPLPKGVNYPLHLHHCHRAPIPLENLVSIRYDNFFASNPPPRIWRDIFEGVKNDLVPTWYY